MTEISTRSTDQEVIELAVREDRILLTEDKDFGQLVYANMQPTGGVIFIRYPAHVRSHLSKAVMSLIKEKGEQLAGSFVVLRPGRIRKGRSRG